MTDDLYAMRGRRVTIDPAKYPNLSGATFTIVDAKRPRGMSDVLVSLRDAVQRRLSRWIPESELLPAPAIPHVKENVMSEQKLITMAKTIAAEKRIDLGAATKEAGDLLRREASEWRASIFATDPSATALRTPSDQKPGQAAFAGLVTQKMAQGLSADAAVEATFSELTDRHQTPASPSLSLSSGVAQRGESFDDVCMRFAREHKIPLRQAISEVGRQRPDLAKGR